MFGNAIFQRRLVTMRKNQLFSLIGLLFLRSLPAQIAVSTDKMNVVFPGVDNPISIAISDVPDSCLRVVPSVGEIQRTAVGKFIWKICGRDTHLASLKLIDSCTNEQVGEQVFRLKRLPDAVPIFGQPRKLRRENNGEFKMQGGIAVLMQNFDFELKPEIVSYEVTYKPFDGDPMTWKNWGARWNAEVSEAIQKARPGDLYYFDHIKYRMPCDPILRDAGGLVFRIH